MKDLNFSLGLSRILNAVWERVRFFWSFWGLLYFPLLLLIWLTLNGCSTKSVVVVHYDLKPGKLLSTKGGECEMTGYMVNIPRLEERRFYKDCDVMMLSPLEPRE